MARGTTLSKSQDGRLSTGIWDCTAGVFRWTFMLDEIVVILEGAATVREESGVCHHLGVGDVAHFPVGLEARWEVPRYVRKLFVVREPDGQARAALWARTMGRRLVGARASRTAKDGSRQEGRGRPRLQGH